MFTPKQLDEITFSKELFGGYNMQSVDEFLEPFTEDYITLYKENALLKSKMKILVEKLEEYRKNEASVREAIANSQKTCDKMVREAEEKCARMLSDAAIASSVNTQRAAVEEQTADLDAQLEEAKRAAAETIGKIQEQMSAAVQAMDEMKSYIKTLERKRVPNKFNAQKKLAGKTGITGKASEERPWLKYYPPGIDKMLVPPELTLTQFLRQSSRGDDLSVIHYYGKEITWKKLFRMAEETARALRAAGVKEGDQVPSQLAAVPEFMALLLAAEQVGASVVCRDNSIAENAEAMEAAKAKIIFAHDFITNAEVEAYTAAGVEKIITVSPLRMADQKSMPEHIMKSLNARYTPDQAKDGILKDWDTFIAEGKAYSGKVNADQDLDRPLFRAYTSGSTGKSKQVIHSARTIVSMLCQMSDYGNADDFRPTWLIAVLPPALVAATVTMMLMPMSSNRLLIMDPFVDVYDIDLEMMRYKPNGWSMIPMFMEILMRSKRIPDDYDMSHMLAMGVGAEAFNNGQFRRAQKWMGEHNCFVPLTAGYGQSEACACMTFPAVDTPSGNGNVGIPIPLNNMGIFRGTKECDYNQLGEVCATGPSMMLGYDNEEATRGTMIRHDDGKLWLHTGDTGYVNEDGVFFALGRGLAKRWNEDPEKRGRLVEIQMENILTDAEIPGVNDCFFVTRPDKEHAGFFVPYLYVVLEKGYTVDDVKPYAEQALEEFQHPVEIIQIPERPFYHFKTNRLHMDPPYAR